MSDAYGLERGWSAGGGDAGEAAFEAGDFNPRAGVRGPALAVIFFCVGLISYWGDQQLAFVFGYLSQVVVGFLAIALVFGVFSSGTPIVFTVECLLLVLFFFWAVLGYPQAIHTGLARQGLVTLAKLLMMAMVVVNAVNGRRAYLWMLAAIMLTGMAASLGGASGLARGVEESSIGTTKVARISGLFGNPNGLGKLMCLSAWAAVSVFFATRSRTTKGLMVGVMVMCVAVVGATGSRQAMVGLALIIATAYWFLMRRIAGGAGKQVLLLLATCGVFGAMLLYMTTTTYWRRMEQLLEATPAGEVREGSAASRLHYMQESLRAAVENPFFGVGYDCISLRIGGYALKSPHNSIVGLAGNTGFVGWGLFFGAWALIFRRIRRTSRLPLPHADRVLLLSSWILHFLLLSWAFTTVVTTYKPFWTLMAVNLSYLVWLQRTYGEAPVTGPGGGAYPAGPAGA